MTTFTSSVYANTPRAVHAGVNHLSIFYNHGTNTTSAGDLILLAKLPHGARVLDWAEVHSSGAGAQTIDLGLLTGGAAGGGVNHSVYASALAINVANRPQGSGICPPVVSVSDGDPVRSGVLMGKIASAGSATVSMTLKIMLTYEVTGGNS